MPRKKTSPAPAAPDLTGLANLLGEQPWHIQPEALAPWVELVRASTAGDAASEAKAAAQADPEALAYHLEGPVAVVPITGVLTKRPVYGAWSGAKLSTGYDEVRLAVRAAAADPAAAAVLLDVESPGGQVDGVHEAGEDLAALAQGKPLYTYANGLMASAAYWLGSAGRTIAAPATANVGSIGVVMAHADFSGMLDKRGIKITYLHAGAFKVMGNDSEPLSDEARAYFQERLDHLYAIFVDTVAANRGVARSQALAMADGKIFVGEKAKEAGLIDAVMSRERFIQLIAKENVMDLTTLKAEHPQVHEAAVAEARQGMVPQADLDKARTETTEAVAAEGARVLGLAAAMLGQEAGDKLTALAKTGATPEQAGAMIAALGIASGGQSIEQKMLDELAKANGTTLEALAGKESGKGPKAEEWPTLVEAYVAENKSSKSEAIKAIDIQHPGLRQKYLGLGE